VNINGSEYVDGGLSVDVLLQLFPIMGHSIAVYELADAEIAIRPETGSMPKTNFVSRNQSIMEGETAGLAAIAAIEQKIAEKTVTVTVAR
jgi:NTE family protein